MSARTPAVLSMCLLAACNDGGQAGIIQMSIVDADGNNPVQDVSEGTLTVYVRHDEQLLDCGGNPCSSAIQDGEYQLDLPLASFVGRTSVEVELESANGDRWIGALPTFQPGIEGVDSTGAARIIVGPPHEGASSTCRTLTLDGLVHTTQPEISPARRDGAAVVRRNVTIIAGGLVADDAPDDHVDRFDELLIDRAGLDTWERSADVGRARGLAINEDVSLVIGDESAWRFVLAARGHAGPAVEEITSLLPGTSSQSALVGYTNGAAIIGGDQLDSVQWIDLNGARSGESMLATARTRPAAALLSNGILVAGGNEAGMSTAEWVALGDNGDAIANDTLPLARGGYLLPSPDGTAAIWIGFEVDGAPSSETYVFRGCPTSCSVSVGDLTWDRARAETTGVATAAGALWLIGGADDAGPVTDVDIVRWSGGAPVIEPGPALEHPRAGAIAFEHAAGIVTVTGGLGDAGLRGDFEMCFPAQLDPP